MRIVRSKSIPNVDMERLLDSLAQIHAHCHTVEGIMAHDGPRRDLVNHGMKGRKISAEVVKRGGAAPDCQLCYDPNLRLTVV